MKFCSKCGELKNDVDFTFSSYTNDGLRRQCKQCESKYKKDFKNKNPDKIKTWKRNWEKNNRKKHLDNRRRLRKIEKNKEKRKNYLRKKYQSDSNYRIGINLRNRINEAINTYGNGKKTNIESYGIEIQKIIDFLGDCPGKRCDFHIDHVVPLQYFNLNDERELQIACLPENHRWLEAKKNISKGCKLENNTITTEILKKLNAIRK